MAGAHRALPLTFALHRADPWLSSRSATAVADRCNSAWSALYSAIVRVVSLTRDFNSSMKGEDACKLRRNGFTAWPWQAFVF